MIKRRSLMCILISSGIFMLQSQRTNFGIALISMTTKRDIQLDNGTVIQAAEFDWDPIKMGYIIAAGAYGALISGFVGAMLCSRFGGVAIFGLSLISCSLINLITPVTAFIGGLYAIIILRSVEGFLAGISIPCAHSILSRWSPPKERSRMLAVVQIGEHISLVITYVLYGNVTYYYGWNSVFYFPGVCGLLWCYVWFYMVKDNPEDDKKIKENELNYLQNCLGIKETESVIHPWSSIFTSFAVWALIFLNITTCWGAIMVHNVLPMFLRDILNLNIKEIGYVSSSPYAVVILITVLSGTLSDFIIKRNWFSITTTRKIFIGLGAILHGIPSFLIPFSYSPEMVSLWIIISTAGGGITVPSNSANFLDIAPRHACIIRGICSTITSVISIICPTVVGYIVANKSRDAWIFVYWATGVQYFLGGIIYLILGTAKEQPWAIPHKGLEKDRISK